MAFWKNQCLFLSFFGILTYHMIKLEPTYFHLDSLQCLIAIQHIEDGFEIQSTNPYYRLLKYLNIVLL